MTSNPNQVFVPKSPPDQAGCKGLYKTFLLSVILIVGYWLLLIGAKGGEEKAVYSDPMNRMVFEMPFLEKCCSWWPISHFIFFFIIGLLFPHCDLVAVLGGILWEVTEVIVYSSLKKGRQGVRRTGSSKIEYSESWWSGSFKDIFFNIAGFYLGKMVILVSGKRICFQELENCPVTEGFAEEKNEELRDEEASLGNELYN